jgi:hypothetical protein
MATNDSGSTTGDEGSSKKTSSKKASSKKTATKKTSTKKAAPRKTSSQRSAPRAEARPSMSATEVASTAARELLELTGKQPEGITGLERTEDGWTVHVEVLELRRIPDTTDVLALYEVTADDRGHLQGYRRVRRYVRGVPGEE